MFHIMTYFVIYLTNQVLIIIWRLPWTRIFILFKVKLPKSVTWRGRHKFDILIHSSYKWKVRVNQGREKIFKLNVDKFQLPQSLSQWPTLAPKGIVLLYIPAHWYIDLLAIELYNKLKNCLKFLSVVKGNYLKKIAQLTSLWATLFSLREMNWHEPYPTSRRSGAISKQTRAFENIFLPEINWCNITKASLYASLNWKDGSLPKVVPLEAHTLQHQKRKVGAIVRMLPQHHPHGFQQSSRPLADPALGEPRGRVCWILREPFFCWEPTIPWMGILEVLGSNLFAIQFIV